MPVFELELTDGRKFQVETDRPPTDSELPDLLKSLENSGGIQKMNPTESNVPVDREAWMKDVQPGEGVSTIPMVEQPMLALGMLGAGALNLGRKTVQRVNQMVPRVEMVNGRLVQVPQVGPDTAVARFETTGPSGDLAEMPRDKFQAGLPIVQAQFPNEDIDPLNRVLGNTLRGLTTPDAVATLGAGGVLKAVGAGTTLAQAVPLGVFGAPMLAHAPETTRQVGTAVGDYVGTSPEYRVPEQKDAMVEAVANEVVSKLMLAGMVGHGGKLAKDYVANRPLIPEVLPAEPQSVAPVNRQINQPAIDVEVLEAGNQLPQARRFYQSESKNPPVDASQLTQVELNARLAANKPLPVVEPKKTYEGGPVIIGENQPQNIAKTLGARYDGVQEWIPGQPKEVYTKPGETPYTVYVDKGTSLQEVANKLKEKEQQDVAGRKVQGGLVVPSLPSKPLGEVQGGKISFSAPAESSAIPSARQAGLPMAGDKGIAPQSPQIGQGAKMIGEPIKASQPKSKSPINESELSDSKNESNEGIEYRNTGGLTKKQQDWITSSARKLLSSPKDLRYSPDRKGEYDGGQLVARLLNNVPPGEREVLEQAGIREKFKAGQKVSSEEVDKWIGENEPKVEVRKFGDTNVSKESAKLFSLEHELDTAGITARYNDNGDTIVGWQYNGKNVKAADMQSPHAQKMQEMETLYNSFKDDNTGKANWQSVAPKPESEMKDYVEIAVVKPLKNKGKTTVEAFREADNQFPSSHNFPPNTLGFVRGYMEGDTFHVIEVQSDWAQNNRRVLADPGSMVNRGRSKLADDPLLAHYERLALKAAIEHARANDAKRIAIQDAESAMLMEGHDRGARYETKIFPYSEKAQAEKYAQETNGKMELQGNNWYVFGDKNIINQEKGMRLHYDQILPKMLRELTGEQGEKVSFGEHKMAMEKVSNAEVRELWQRGQAGENIPNNVITKPRKDLIFKNADGTPKTDITALSFPLEKVSEAQSKAPFTTMGSDKVKETKTSEGKIEYYHSGIPLTKETLDAVKDLLKLPGKALNLYAEPIVEKLGRVGGPVAKKATEEFQRMISRQKQVYGELSPVVDEAKKATGKIGGGNTWLRKVNNITDKAGVNNMFASNEGGVVVPSEAAKTVQALNKANLAIGNSAKLANPDFVPTGKLQRVLTNYGYDIIRRGNGPAWEAWTEGVAKANKIPVGDVQDFFNKWKEELDKPSSDVASMDRISQDFSRRFPNTVTHIKPGMAWHEVVTADPFNYIESAAQRTSHAVAFREVYPLTRDAKGKLGPSGYLQATRKAIQKELNTAGFDSTLFDNLVSVVQGHPLDTFTRGWNAPDSMLGGGYRMGQQVLGQPLKSLMLTANTISNAGEILAGGPSIFLGAHNVIPAMAKLAKDNSLEKYLEFIGARNKAMYNMSFDPTSPVRSGTRIASNMLRKATAQQLFNEIQETTSAMSAKFVADRIRNKELSKYESDRIETVARMMGMTKQQAEKMVAGDADLLRQFETKAAASLTSGNQSMGEKSRLGTSRVFNELFWFQTYPQMKANQARKLFGNLFEDINRKDWTAAYHNAALIGRFAGGTTLQGAITLMLMGLATAGIYGLAQQGNEAKEETSKFAWDSMKAGMGGPLSILARLAQNSGDAKSLTQGIVSLSPPVNSGQDLLDAGMGTGKYEGRTVGERIGMFLESKTPGMKIARTLLAISGLSQDDLELRSAMKEFYKWRREQPNYKPATSGGADEADVEIRTQMKRVKEVIQKGGDWQKELEKVKDIVYAQHSLRSGTMLELNAKPLSKEQEASLVKRIGQEGVDKIKAYDTMLREVARNLGDVNKEKKDITDIKPTGDKYVDQTTSTQRSERVMELLKPETVKFLEANKKKVPSFEPEFGLASKKLMTKEQGALFEKILAEEVDKRLASTMTNQVFLAKPLVKRQERISERLEFAKEMAEVRFRAALRQQASQE